MQIKYFNLCEDVQDYALQEGLSEAKILEMVKHSARVTHAKGNRRFHDYIFDVQGDEVFVMVNMLTNTTSEVSCKTCKDEKQIPVFNECPHCDGLGCPQCDEGLVRAFIDCPDCGTKHATKFARQV